MRLLAITVCTAGLLGVSASAALAGEVKGPPGTQNNTNDTGAPANANSNCAYSGLNDFDLSDPGGQIVSQVQTAATLGSSTVCRKAPRARWDSARAEPTWSAQSSASWSKAP